MKYAKWIIYNLCPKDIKVQKKKKKTYSMFKFFKNYKIYYSFPGLYTPKKKKKYRKTSIIIITLQVSLITTSIYC